MQVHQPNDTSDSGRDYQAAATSRGSLKVAPDFNDVEGQPELPQQARNEASKRISLTSIRQKAIQQIEDATIRTQLPSYTQFTAYQSPSPTVDSPSPILSKMPLSNSTVSPLATGKVEEQQDENDNQEDLLNDGILIPATEVLSPLTSARPKFKSRPATKNIPRENAEERALQIAEAQALALQAASFEDVSKAEQRKDERSVSPSKMGFKLPDLGDHKTTLKKTSPVKEATTKELPASKEPEFMQFKRTLKAVESGDQVVQKSVTPEVSQQTLVTNSNVKRTDQVTAVSQISNFKEPEATSPFKYQPGTSKVSQSASQMALNADNNKNTVGGTIEQATPTRNLKSVAAMYEKPQESKLATGFTNFRSNLRNVKTESTQDAQATTLPRQPQDVQLSTGLSKNKTSLSKSSLTPSNVSGSHHDLSNQISKLKPVESKSSQSSLVPKEASSDSQNELSAFKKKLKPVGLQGSQTELSKGQKSNPVPEFLTIRNKIKSPDSNVLTEVKTELSPPAVQQQPSGNGGFSRFGVTSTKLSPTKQQQSVYSYQAPKIVPGKELASQVTLKGVRGDNFISASGGATRPVEPLLLIVKGKKKIAACSVPTTVKSLNQADAFILDIAIPNANGAKEDPEKPSMRNIFVCSGEKTSKVRRTKTIEMANLIKDMDYSGKADIVLVELSNIKDRTIPEKELQFWQTLLKGSSNKAHIVQSVSELPISDSVDDLQFEKNCDDKTYAYCLDENSTEPRQVAQNGKELTYGLLSTDSCVVVDCHTEIYIWSGRAAKEECRSSAQQFAEAKAKSRNLSAALLFRDGERFERTIFKSKFEDWPTGNNLKTHNVLEVKQAGNIQAKDKAWRVYDRGSDIRKVDKVDIARMYDKNSSPEIAVAKNSEALDIDPSELIKRDWGFTRMRIWAVQNMSNKDSTSKSSSVQFDESMLSKMERKFDLQHPFVFQSSECYIFLYEYKERPSKMNDQVLVERTKFVKEELIASMKENAVMYAWSGAESSVSDQGFMAHFAVELEKLCRDGKLQVNAKARHVRISEGKEPIHFLNAVRGGNIPRDQPPNILQMLPKAEVPPAQVVVVCRSQSSTSNQLYHVFGTYSDSTRAGQCFETSASSLSSSSSYVLTTSKEVYIWNGLGSFPWEQDASSKLASAVLVKQNQKVIVLQEGQETSTFWAEFKGGKQPYDQIEVYKQRPKLSIQTGFVPTDAVSLASTYKNGVMAPYDVRLWRLNFFVNGNPSAIEVFPFTSSDLDDDGVYIFDTYFLLFVWIGSKVGRTKSSSPTGQNVPDMLKKVPLEQLSSKSLSSGFRDIRLGIETAINYADFVNERESGRLSRAKTFVVQSGSEPLEFKSQFVAWSPREDSQDMWPSNIPVQEASDMIFAKTYSVAQLRKYAVDRNELPFGLDLERLESYLETSDFESVFGMSREKFFAQPQWKQTDMKKKTGLF